MLVGCPGSSTSPRPTGRPLAALGAWTRRTRRARPWRRAARRSIARSWEDGQVWQQREAVATGFSTRPGMPRRSRRS
eukprot:14774056-Alexandrium_andersonii.AAC.1